MESHEVLKQAVRDLGAKQVASRMNLSTSLIYKWCEANDSPESAGADNPLDRISKLLDITGDKALIAWLCQKADGYFVKNPNASVSTSTPLSGTRKILKEFTELLDAVSTSLANDQVIDREEASGIRDEWETLKSVTESFVVACERGNFAEPDPQQ